MTRCCESVVVARFLAGVAVSDGLTYALRQAVLCEAPLYQRHLARSAGNELSIQCNPVKLRIVMAPIRISRCSGMAPEIVHEYQGATLEVCLS